ncbi:hypothetical protein AC579_4291 [Pseudocercospora musae]|uniref:Uncharacterized protein n=1 Tax=Pseudocercospora musae TaxID=113226 RepID=A0A139IB95_9PEZI|nr:hypothetical protein AC579_4291 [Pseudocercospora musae]
MTPAKRAAPSSSQPRRIGPKFVLAGYLDPHETQDASEPPAKKLATAERVYASRALPLASLSEQPRDLIYGPYQRTDSMSSAGPRSSRPDPQLDVSDGVHEASNSPSVNLAGQNVAQSANSNCHDHISPPARVPATVSAHPNHVQSAASGLKPLNRQTSTTNPRSLSVLRRHLVGDSASGLTRSSAISLTELETWLQQQGSQIDARVGRFGSEYGSVGGGRRSRRNLLRMRMMMVCHRLILVLLPSGTGLPPTVTGFMAINTPAGEAAEVAEAGAEATVTAPTEGSVELI